MEEGFDNQRLEGRPSSVDLRLFEPPSGKRLSGGRVLGRWSRQINFKKISSKKGMSLWWNLQEIYGRDFGIAFQSVIRVKKEFKILPGNGIKMLSHNL
jgi:hypothetical protein